MIKKTLSAALAAAMLTCSASAAEFTDTDGHWAEATINNLTQRGIIHGISENTFDPEGSVTRAQFLKMIMETVGLETVPYRDGECLDANFDDWYAPYLQSALDKGLIADAMISGYNSNIVTENDADGNIISSKVIYSGMFCGDTPITREEAAYLAVSLYQYTLNPNTMKTLDGTAVTVFADIVNISEWAYPSVYLAAISGIITGTDTGDFLPKNTATRAQAAVIAERIIKLTEAH